MRRVKSDIRRVRPYLPHVEADMRRVRSEMRHVKPDMRQIRPYLPHVRGDMEACLYDFLSVQHPLAVSRPLFTAGAINC